MEIYILVHNRCDAIFFSPLRNGIFLTDRAFRVDLIGILKPRSNQRLITLETVQRTLVDAREMRVKVDRR